MRMITAGSISQTVRVFIQDSSAGDGSGLTGLAWNSAGLVGHYMRDGASGETAITLATATLGTFASGGLVEVDATNMPGLYELSLPNAAVAAGAKDVTVMLRGAANMVPCVFTIQLPTLDLTDATIRSELHMVHQALVGKRDIDGPSQVKRVFDSDGVSVLRTLTVTAVAGSDGSSGGKVVETPS